MKHFGLGSLLGFSLCLATLGCSVDEIPDGLGKTPGGDSATVKWDLYHKPLPEIPFPNDQAMWPDPTSRTGMRVNASVVAPTGIEETARKKFDQLEGFGTYAAITVGFEKRKSNPAQPAIDVANVIARHQGDDYELNDDAIYVVNLDTGIPAIMDLGEGSFPYVVKEKHKYWRNDTRPLEQNLMWDTADETIDPTTGKRRPTALLNGVPSYKPEWDTDFDGVLDLPNLKSLDACPSQVDVALTNVTDRERDRCITDNLLTFYERETDTLIMRPLIPLIEKTQYAVVVTDRMLDCGADPAKCAGGAPVRSPFDFIYHPAQEEAMARLKAHLSNPDLASYYGDLGGTGLTRVAFAWTFTTQPVQEDLQLIRDGLYGHGPLSKLSKDFPAHSELARAAGQVDLEALADSDWEEPSGWESDPKCQKTIKNFHIVKFDVVKSTIQELAKQAFGFEGPTLDTLIASFDSISHIAIGEFDSPFFLAGGPKGEDPNASFDMDFRTGDGKIHRDRVQFLIVVPKESATKKQPFPVAYYGHGYGSSSLEVLGFAGHLAAHGIASVGMNATFHGLELGETELQLAKNLFSSACEGPFASALLSGRARDLDENGSKDSGGDYWTAYLFHTRDVVRQSAVDLVQMFRVLKGFDGEKLARHTKDPHSGRLMQDYNGDGEPNDLAGDFDGDGTPDVGGPKSEFYAWGQSLGGILAPFVAALDSNVVASAPTSGAGGLLDVGARTFQGGAFEGLYLRMFGPLVVGVPAKEFYDAGKQKETKCTQSQISLRFVLIDVNDDREVEFGCAEKTPYAPEGGTVMVSNGRSGEVRCARIGTDGRFRIGIPTSVGDKLEVQMYDVPDAVDSYHPESGCNITADESHRIELVNTWGVGVIPEGGVDPLTGEEVCTAEGGCSKFQNKYFAAGSPLVAPTEGFGYVRQTPSLRRLMNLASHIIDPGDPVNYSPYYALRPMLGPEGDVMPPKGMLNIVTVGDMNVPLNSGIAIGRAAGAVPFLAPDAIDRYPAYADFVTPVALYSALGGLTPNRALIENHVIEGVSRLARSEPADLSSCKPNERPVTTEDVVCHPNCTDTDTASCLSGQTCVSGRCVKKPVSQDDCAMALYDIDVLDEGKSLYGETEAQVPLRTGRISMPATADSIDAVWQPRLKGVPFAADKGAWKADQRVVAQLQAYIEPRGTHGFEPANPCENWDSGQYLINLVGRFFASSGSDPYYLSHPTSHQCLGKPTGQGSCSFVTVPPK